MKNEYEFNKWLSNALPTGKKEFTFSRDAIEMLLRMAWAESAKAAESSARSSAAEDERERKYGPQYI